ncbi:unnamed protein product [Phytomonas sp. EM1]|nr:unnamed protein product [Phytomonas sp. EM1]|eukprot:CCW63621.1 unnamed protein product [Phytomonas sp. isolate EM1]
MNTFRDQSHCSPLVDAKQCSFEGQKSDCEHQSVTISDMSTLDILKPLFSERVEQLQRALNLLQKDLLWPFFEPVERIKVVDSRAVSSRDVVNTFVKQAFSDV